MKYDVSNKISETVADYSVSHRQIARAAGVSPSTISCASKAGYMVTKPVRDAIDCGCNKLSMYTPTATLAANLEKQVEQLRDTVEQTQLAPINFSDDQKAALKKPLDIFGDATTQTFAPLSDNYDLLESLRRDKAELQKALAARINEVENIAADLAHERQKNETQYQSIRQCFAEIKRLQGELNHQKLITASRNADLAVYQKELEAADNRADDAEDRLKLEKELLNDQVNLVIKKNNYISHLEQTLSTNRAWTWFFILLAFIAAVVGVVK